MKKYKLSELYEMSSGISTAKEQAGHGSPFVSFSTIFNNYFLPDVLPDQMDTTEQEQEVYSVRKGDILITRTSETIDELAMSSVATKDYPGATFSGFAKRLRPINDRITYYKYLAFYLRSDLFRKAVTNNAFMTLRASFNEDIFSFLEIYLPKYSQQCKIGDLLFLVEKRIKLNNKINSELEAMAKTIYDYWFVQFDFPDENGKPFRSSGGEMVRNEKLKKEIPKGWRVQNIAKNSLSKLIKPGVDTFEVKTYLATADVNGTSFGDGNPIEFETRENRANMQPSINSVWFAKMKNSVKHLFLNEAMSEFIESTILSTGFCGIQCTETGFEYIASYISSPQFEITKDTLAHGATQQAVNNNDLLLIKIVIPNDETLKLFHQSTKAIYGKISANIKENQELTNLRDWLLPMLMNGQVTVENNV